MKVSRRDNLDRYYLLEWRGWALFLHRIHHDEEPGVYHSHPWTWVSLVLGAYLDHRIGEPGEPGRLRALVNWCRAGVPHRVTLPFGPVWTLCLHAPRSARWAVFDAAGRMREWEPWRGTANPDRRSYAVDGHDPIPGARWVESGWAGDLVRLEWSPS